MTPSNPARAGSDGAGGPTPTLPKGGDSGKLTADHAALLATGAIPAGVAIAAGCYSVTTRDQLPGGLRWSGTGIVFPQHPLHGDPVPQYRPDNPSTDADGRAAKYLFPTGPVPLNVVPAMRSRIVLAERVLVVEGTRQALAAVAHAPPDCLVVGIAGCWGWSRDGQANPELAELCQNRDVVVCLDADATSNIKVHQAAARLGAHLEAVGATSVRHVTIPASGTVGLDDYLGQVPDPGAVLARLIDHAGKLGKAPKATKGRSDLFDSEGLRVDAAYERIRADWSLLVEPSGRIATYADGVFRADRDDATAWDAITTGLLGGAYRSHHHRTLTEYTAGRLRAAGEVATDDPHPGLVNVANGMLDPLSGHLSSHGPEHRSRVQFAVPWDPGADCPTLDAWLPTVVAADLTEDLIEATSLLLETRPHRQRRALFLHGPSRSGKSTWLRLIEAIVGGHRSAVTMAELSSDAFAAADLHGSLLNTAADLSASHLEDVSLFKALTGDDPVRAQRKYGQPFTFRARCLFAFSANAIPTSSEVSTAYLNRVRPIVFPWSFAGAEDPTIEEQMTAELAGLFTRLVAAYQAHADRGGYLDTEATRSAAEEFARASDRVRLFLAETTTETAEAWTPRTELLGQFEEWCRQNRRHPVSAHRLYESLETAGYGPSKRGGTRGFKGLTLRPERDWGAPDPESCPRPAPSPPPTKPQATASRPDPGGQKGQVPFVSPTREAKNGGEKNPRVRGKWAGAAPSAPGPDPFAGPRVREPL